LMGGAVLLLVGPDEDEFVADSEHDVLVDEVAVVECLGSCDDTFDVQHVVERSAAPFIFIIGSCAPLLSVCSRYGNLSMSVWLPSGSELSPEALHERLVTLVQGRVRARIQLGRLQW